MQYIVNLCLKEDELPFKIRCILMRYIGCPTSYRIVIGSKLRFSRLIGKFEENVSLQKVVAENDRFFKYYGVYNDRSSERHRYLSLSSFKENIKKF